MHGFLFVAKNNEGTAVRSVAVVLHPLQLIRIPTALRALPGLCGKVLHSVAEVVFQVLFRGDVAARDAVVVAAHVHQRVLPGFLGRREVVGGDALGCHPGEPGAELSSIDHANPPLATN